VIEAALDEEMSDHLGYDKHAVEGRNRGNSRNGTRANLTEPIHGRDLLTYLPRAPRLIAPSPECGGLAHRLR